VNRIPLNYLPFPLEQVSVGVIASHVVRHLASLLTKGASEVGIDEFCNGYIPVWGYIGTETQREVKDKTRDVLHALARKSLGREMLSRVSNDPLRWRLMDRSEFRKRMRSLRTCMEQLVLELEGETFQQELPFD
jgi:hypothetical protein